MKTFTTNHMIVLSHDHSGIWHNMPITNILIKTC